MSARLGLRGRIALAALLWAALFGGVCWGLGQAGADWSDPAWWQRQRAVCADWQAARPLTFLLGFVGLFTLLSALALPGCAALALLAGGSFGALGGTLVVGLASTLGASIAFLAARHLARAPVQRRLGHRPQVLDAAARRDGPLWLFWLRLLPLLPYPVINPLLGLSRLSLAGFFWPSLAGLTLGSVPYVWAGSSLDGLWRGGAVDTWALAGAATLAVATATLARRRRPRPVASARPVP